MTELHPLGSTFMNGGKRIGRQVVRKESSLAHICDSI